MTLLVYNALSSVTPKTVSQLVEETGLSRSTVVSHLGKLKARARVPQVGRVAYLRPETTFDDPVRHWRHSRAAVAELVRTLRITEHADPVKLADEFLLVGRQLVAIGEAIDRVKMDPDWYIQLGGHFWLSEEKGTKE